jgi:hypothetical protein
MWATYPIWNSRGVCVRAWPGSLCCPHLDGSDLTCIQKLQVAPIKRHFSEKFTVTKMCAIQQFIPLRNLQTNIFIGYWINLIFPNRIFFIEMLSLCVRDRHMKNFVLTKVFHIGQWNCFDLLWRQIPFWKKNLRSVAYTEKCWRFFKEGSCFRSHTVVKAKKGGKYFLILVCT